MGKENDLYYATSMVEYVGRKTKNSRTLIVQKLGMDGIRYLIDFADVNHCLSFEQVSDELIEDYKIQNGNFNSVDACKFEVPSATRIGKVYARLIESLSESEEQYAEKMYEVFTSDLPDAISDFNSSLFLHLQTKSHTTTKLNIKPSNSPSAVFAVKVEMALF